MAKSGPEILREAREKANLSREQLAMRMECISHGTLKRWEYGESRPDSCDVARMGELLGDNTLWPRWMCAVDDEYAKRHPYQANDLPAAMAVAKVGFEAEDVQGLVNLIVRDLVDGRQDDKALAARFGRELDELISAAEEAKQKLAKGGK